MWVYLQNDTKYLYINTFIVYIVQAGPFEILEEYGCTALAVQAGLTILLVDSIPLILSVLSITLYSRAFILLIYILPPHWIKTSQTYLDVF